VTHAVNGRELRFRRFRGSLAAGRRLPRASTNPVSIGEFLGYFSGLRFLDPTLPLPTLLGTMAIAHACDAVMCRLFAENNGYPRNLWTVIGFVFGVWAVACLIVLPKREAR
jgi:hypothetical protein